MRENDYDILYCNYTEGETKKYLHQVVEERYKEHLQQVLEALDMAACAHKDQLRYNDAPYIIHPMRVALMLLKFDKNTIAKVFVAALLHDTVEKTGITYSDIEKRFGGYVAKLVQSVTRNHDEKQSPEEKTEAKYQNWLAVISSSHEVRMIKVCEDLDNMVCWKSIPEDHLGRRKISCWLAEVRKMSLPLARITNLEVYNVMRQEYEYYAERGFTYQPTTL